MRGGTVLWSEIFYFVPHSDNLLTQSDLPNPVDDQMQVQRTKDQVHRTKRTQAIVVDPALNPTYPTRPMIKCKCIAPGEHTLTTIPFWT